MPTGYTARIEDGSITTGKDFLKLCTRAFGIAIDLKDEPLSIPTPTKFKPDTYYRNRLDKARAELENTKNMSFEDAKTKMAKSHADRIKMYKSLAEQYIKHNEEYAKVRAEVEAWNPPTEEHCNLKIFALKQIDISVEKQEQIDYYVQKANEKLDDSDEAVKRFIAEQIESCCEEVIRAEAAWEGELERVASKNTWMKKFLDSL